MGKGKQDYTFESKERALKYITPVLRDVARIMQRTWLPVHVPDSLKRLESWLLRM